jgi:hypothetical protein
VGRKPSWVEETIHFFIDKQARRGASERGGALRADGRIVSPPPPTLRECDVHMITKDAFLKDQVGRSS